MIAHPLRQRQHQENQLDEIEMVRELRLRNIEFPTKQVAETDSGSESDGSDGNKFVKPKIVLAVGPEGGWAEDYELDLFKSLGFQQVTLGTRILRSDVAVVSLLSLAHDVCVEQVLQQWESK